MTLKQLPPLDHIARALLVRGARDEAIAFLESALARGGDDRPRCEALLSAIRARPNDRVGGPPIKLDASLVEALAERGRLGEARQVARAVLAKKEGAAPLLEALERVHDDDSALPEPWRGRWRELLAKGSLSVLGAIERELGSGPPWLVERVGIVARLLRGFSTQPSGPEIGFAPIGEGLRASIRRALEARDLLAALSAVRSAPGEPGAIELAAALARLVAATEKLLEEQGPQGNSTMPMEGHGVALFQLRMGNLAEAERAFRRIVLEQASDHVARERLADIIQLRRAVEPPGVEEARAEDGQRATMPGDKTPAPDWLNKRQRKPSVEGWLKGGKKEPAASEWDNDVATSVLKADQEAELHLRAGQPERALQIYLKLVDRNPGNAQYARRAKEIEAMIAERRVPIAGEATVQRDLSAIRDDAMARRSMPFARTAPSAPELPAIPAPSLSPASMPPPAPHAPATDFDEPTMIERRRPIPKPSPDPLAQTATGAPAPDVLAQTASGATPLTASSSTSLATIEDDAVVLEAPVAVQRIVIVR